MSIELAVSGMSCGHCVQSITQAIKHRDPSAQVSVDLASGRVTVDSTEDAAELIELLDALGFSAQTL